MKAENDNAILKIKVDHDAFNTPRDWDNFGTMVCWHRNYDLGDKNNFSTVEDFYTELARDVLNQNRELLNDLAIDEMNSPHIKRNKGKWDILNKYDEPYNFYYSDSTGYDSLEEAEEELKHLIEDCEDDILNLVSDEKLKEIAFMNDEIVILPLYLYDHSGITMNTTGFHCRWDSGQVGYIYATKEDIVKELGSFDVSRAEEILKSEVEVYDKYISGEVYGFVLEEKKKCDSCNTVDYNHLDSCWGFYGLDSIIEELKYSLDDKHKSLLDNLEYAY